MTVADAKGRRWDAATGVVFAILTVIALVLPGTPPKADDPTSKISFFLVDHRKDILIGNFVIAVAAIFFIWFIGTLRSYLRAGEGGEGRLSAAAFGGGVAGIVMLLAGAGVLNAVSFHLAKGSHPSEEIVRAVFDASGAFFAMSAVAFAALFAAASCSGARSGALPPWAYWSGSVVALLQVLSAAALFDTSGPFKSGGVFSGFVAPGLGILWIVLISGLIMGREAVPPVARTEP